MGFTVVIDPGHGGLDRGATKGSIIESEIALSVAKKLELLLSQEIGIKTILTRSTDKPVTLQTRVLAAEETKADIFISLHGNSSKDSRVKGAEFYVGASSPNIDSSSTMVLPAIIQDIKYNVQLLKSHDLAEDIFSTWKLSPNVSPPRSIKQAAFYVINKNSIPSILVELGFITNPKEGDELNSEEAQNQIAKNLQIAVQSFRSKVEN